MTCPKCGFVSYPGLSQCKKCGYRFVSSEPEASPGGVPTAPQAVPTGKQVSAQEETLSIASPMPEIESISSNGPTTEVIPEIPSMPLPSAQTPATEWRDELAGKLEDHRRKRSRLRGNFDPGSSLDFQFGDQGAMAPTHALDADLAFPSRTGAGLDAQLDGSRSETSPLDGLRLEKPAEGIRVLSSAAVEAGESQFEEESSAPPVGIIVDSPRATRLRFAGQPAAGGLRVAPLGARLAAGVLDALILLVGGGLFAVIFFIVGGRATLGPLNLAVFGSIATLFVLAYFAMFCALSSSTPGLLMMNLEFRSQAGGPPSPTESFWRAFGYLISGASLMLGFAWALVDSEHLTWHDHMSGTYIATIEP